MLSIVSSVVKAARAAEMTFNSSTDSSKIEDLIATIRRLNERLDQADQINEASSRSPSPQFRNTTPDRHYTSASSLTAPTRGTNNYSRQPPRQDQRRRTFTGPTRQIDQRQESGSTSQESSKRCSKCGLSHTINERCPAMDKKCNYCSKFSHFARMCWAKLRGNPPAQNPNCQ
jgi:hypothetical protein